MFDFDNAFNPDNDHLWSRCKAHTRGVRVPKRCVFVENCDECQAYCLHDAPLYLQATFPNRVIEVEHAYECWQNRGGECRELCSCSCHSALIGV